MFNGTRMPHAAMGGADTTFKATSVMFKICLGGIFLFVHITFYMGGLFCLWTKRFVCGPFLFARRVMAVSSFQVFQLVFGLHTFFPISIQEASLWWAGGVSRNE